MTDTLTGTALAVGDLAPDFTLPQDRGAPITLSALRPKPVVLFFYPKDDTPGCTKQAVGFTTLQKEFEEAGGTILGVSKDSVAKHEKFRAKHDLGVALLSDAEADVCETYGVWKEKNMYGKTYMGIERTTFLIDGTGRIARIWPKVTVEGHMDEVLGALKALA